MHAARKSLQTFRRTEAAGPEPGTFPKFDDPAERMSGTARKDRATSGINMVFIYMNTDLVSVLFVFLSKLLPKERV